LLLDDGVELVCAESEGNRLSQRLLFHARHTIVALPVENLAVDFSGLEGDVVVDLLGRSNRMQRIVQCSTPLSLKHRGDWLRQLGLNEGLRLEHVLIERLGVVAGRRLCLVGLHHFGKSSVLG
jgi:hypothetical protein